MEEPVEKPKHATIVKGVGKSSRVKGRPYRQINPKNRLHRLGNSNTTGTFGTVSTWNVRVSHSRKQLKGGEKYDQRAEKVAILSGLPGRNRAAKRKRVAKVFCGNGGDLFRQGHKEFLYRLRADMHTASLIGNFLNCQILPEHATTAYLKVTEHLLIMMSLVEKSAMDKADVARFYSVKGMIKAGKITKGEPVKRLWSKIERALFQLNDNRQPTQQQLGFDDMKPEPQENSKIITGYH